MYCLRLEHLGVDDRERRDLGVPFQQRRDAAGQLVGQPVQLPHRIDHVAVVRVDEVRAAVGVAGQVELHDALVRHGADVLDRVEVVVDAARRRRCSRRAAGRSRSRRPAGARNSHSLIVESAKRDVGAGVLQHQRPFEEVLHGADALDDVRAASPR